MTLQSNLGDLIAATEASTRPERLPTNTTTRGHAVHRWFNFIAGFSPEFVGACVDLAPTNASNMVLLDPFSGCGTAPLEARLMGVSAVAYEPHPFFAAISKAKADSPKYWAELPQIHAALARGLLRRDTRGLNISASATAFLSKMFKEDDIIALFSARRELAEAGLDANPLAVLTLSRMLDHCCFAATDGIYKAPSTTKKTISPKAALDRVFEAIKADSQAAQFGEGRVKIHARSSEQMSELADDSIDVVVTSPPYLNNFDFAEMTRMYLYFWGLAGSWGEITDKVRSRLIVNTTTALKGHKDKQAAYRDTLPTKVRLAAEEAVRALTIRRREKAGKKEYDLLVYPYLSQMQQVLKETLRVMKPGAPFHMMVSDAALYGVHLPAPQWLAQIMAELGYQDVQCELVRARGHRWQLQKREGSATGLGEYCVSGRA